MEGRKKGRKEETKKQRKSQIILLPPNHLPDPLPPRSPPQKNQLSKLTPNSPQTAQLNDPTLLHQQCYYGGTWRDSTSSLRFPIYDPGTSLPFASCPATTPADVPDAVAFAHSTFQSYSKVNPRVRAKLLLQWNDLIEANRDDLATMVTYETGKPLAEAQAELTYALGFTWWFAGEAERIQGTVSTPSAAGRRIFTVKMPIGVAVALVPWVSWIPLSPP